MSEPYPDPFPDLLADSTMNQADFRVPIPVAFTQKHGNTNPLRLVVIGETGVGKSSLCNCLIPNTNFFQVCAKLTVSGTTMAMTKPGKNFRGETVIITDTQGYNDTESRDFDHAKQMIKTIQDLGHVNAFLLVFNGQQARWNGATLDVLKLLAANFPSFWDNLIVVLNFMPQDPTAIKRRNQVQDDFTKMQEVQKALRSIYNTTAALPVICLDTNFNTSENKEAEAFKDAIDSIFTNAKMFVPYDPSPAMAHQPKLTEAEEKIKELSKNYVKVNEYANTMKLKYEEAKRSGNVQEMEKIKKEHEENLARLSDQHKEMLKLVTEANEKQRASSEA